MKIEVGKTYETRHGKLVRVLCTDAKGSYPVIGLVGDTDRDGVVRWTADGRFIALSNGGQDYDLVREHVPLTYRWYRVFNDKDVGVAHPDKPNWDYSCAGLIKLAFDPSGNLVIDKCEITGAQPNG